MVELLDDVVDVLKEAEQEPVVRLPDQLTYLLGEPDVVDRIIETSGRGVVLHDLQPVPRLQALKQGFDREGLRKVQGQLNSLGKDTAIVEVDRDDVRASVGHSLEELEEAARTMGEPDIEGQEAEGGKPGLEIADPIEFRDYPGIFLLGTGHLEEDGVSVDPMIVLDPVYIDRVLLQELGNPVEGPGLVGDTGNERVPIGHGDRSYR